MNEEEQMKRIEKLVLELRGEVEGGMENLNRIKAKALKIEVAVDEIKAEMSEVLETTAETMEELVSEMKEKGYVFVWNIGEPDDDISFESPENYIRVNKAFNVNGMLMSKRMSLWAKKGYAEENLHLPYNYG